MSDRTIHLVFKTHLDIGFTDYAAKVRTLGQIELLFTFAVSWFVLRDRHTSREFAASAVVMAGVLGVMLAG